MIRLLDDVKSAFILSAGFGVAGASAVPLLLDSPILPPQARSLPLPMPVFCAVLVVQLTVVYGLLGLAGLRMARGRRLEPAPYLTAFWDRTARRPGWLPAAIGLGVGLACGCVLVAIVSAIQRYFPHTLPGMLHPPGLATALAASAAGSLGEEILCRLFVLSLVLRILPPGRSGVIIAVAVSALVFAALHAPGFVVLYFGSGADLPPDTWWRKIPILSWVWVMGLNGLLGLAFGAVFVRYGIGCAVLAHFGNNLIWHVASQLLRG